MILKDFSLFRRLASAILATGLLGCSSMGPKTIPSDQFNYNAAISESTAEQLLSAMVRLRYSETPTFLKVSSVINQYSRSVSAGAGAGANTALTGDNTATVNANADWNDRPTITYVPVSGSDFSKNLLTPLPPSTLFGMMQSGWPAELILQVAIWSINGLENDIARPSGRRHAEDEFYTAFELLSTLRQENVLGLKIDMADGKLASLALAIPPQISPAAAAHAKDFRALLGLDPGVNEIPIRYGLFTDDPNSIAVLTGSIWDMMLNLAWQFEVPKEHIEEGRTSTTFQSSRNTGIALVEVHFAKKRPKDAFAAIFAHDYWFYIDQKDRLSKRTFSFLQVLMNLAETRQPDRSPVITISN